VVDLLDTFVVAVNAALLTDGAVRALHTAETAANQPLARARQVPLAVAQLQVVKSRKTASAAVQAAMSAQEACAALSTDTAELVLSTAVKC